MDRATAEEARPTQVKLKIDTKQDLQKFLQAILPEFLRVVDPRESGLLDSLYAGHLMTETDNESMSARDVLTRKDQARKLWLLLNKLPVDKFITTVAPELLEKFPHIIPQSYLSSSSENDPGDVHLAFLEKRQLGQDGDECVAHVIKSRVRVTSVADMMYHKGFMEFGIYETIVSGDCETDASWTEVFETFTNRKETELEQMDISLKQLMVKHNLHVPSNLADILSRGLPCTCKLSGVQLPKELPHCGGKVTPWLLNSRFSINRSSGGSETQANSSTVDPATTTITTTNTTTTRSSQTIRSSTRSSEASTLVAEETKGANVSAMAAPDDSENQQEHESQDRAEDQRQRDTVIPMNDESAGVKFDDLPKCSLSMAYWVVMERRPKLRFVIASDRLPLPVRAILIISMCLLLFWVAVIILIIPLGYITMFLMTPVVWFLNGIGHLPGLF